MNELLVHAMDVEDALQSAISRCMEINEFPHNTKIISMLLKNENNEKSVWNRIATMN